MRNAHSGCEDVLETDWLFIEDYYVISMKMFTGKEFEL